MRNTAPLLLMTFLFYLLLSGCTDSPAPEMEAPTMVNSGRADFATMVAIGNSLTAGIRANHLAGQNEENSFPALIARQMGKTAGRDAASDFVVPYVSPAFGLQQSFLEYNAYGLPVVFQFPVLGTVTNSTYARPFNNLGIPLAKAFDVVNATSASNASTNNPFVDLILRNAGSSTPVFDPPQTVLQQAIALQPTFLLLWIGNNDVLGAATSGIPTVNLPTPSQQFEAELRQVFENTTQSNNQLRGAIANIPDVRSIPFFTTVPAEISLPEGGKQFLYITRENGSVDQASTQDRILLSAVSVIGDTSGNNGPAGVRAGLHQSAPLADNLVLDETELQVLGSAISSNNIIIANLAQQYDFALIDANNILQSIAASGIEIDGIRYTSDLVDGGIFSIDGVHPAAAGTGIVANAFIDAINNHFGSEIPNLTVSEVE